MLANDGVVKNRRSFLIAAGAVGVTTALARRSERSAALAASAKKAPSDAARASAAGLRRFDSKLDASELESIARGIDDAAQAAAALRPKRRPLRNSDEPVTIFVVPIE